MIYGGHFTSALTPANRQQGGARHRPFPSASNSRESLFCLEKSYPNIFESVLKINREGRKTEEEGRKDALKPIGSKKHVDVTDSLCPLHRGETVSSMLTDEADSLRMLRAKFKFHIFPSVRSAELYTDTVISQVW